MTDNNRIFLVEDNIGDTTWLIDLLESRGYVIDDESNEKSAKQRLDAIKKGDESYVLAIFDVMVATMDFMDLVDFDDTFVERSQNTGIRLCEYARKELRIAREELPIVCLSARDDKELKDALKSLNIPLFSRTPQRPEEGLRAYIKKKLPDLTQ